MKTLNDKTVGGVSPQKDFLNTDCNEIASELQNLYEIFGIAPTSSDLNQVGKGIANYVTSGNYFSETGVADAYVLSSTGSRQLPTVYAEGMVVDFTAGATNTVNNPTLAIGTLPAKTMTQADGVAIPIGILPTNAPNFWRYRTTSDSFVLVGPLISNTSVKFLTDAFSVSGTLDVAGNTAVGGTFSIGGTGLTVCSSTPTDGATTTPISSDWAFDNGRVNPNLLDNGDFGFWQRGIWKSDGGFLADRWYIRNTTRTSGTSYLYRTFSPSAIQEEGNNYYLKQTVANHYNRCYIQQNLELAKNMAFWSQNELTLAVDFNFDNEVEIHLAIGIYDYSNIGINSAYQEIYASSWEVVSTGRQTKIYNFTTNDLGSLPFTVDPEEDYINLRVWYRDKTTEKGIPDGDYRFFNIKLEESSTFTGWPHVDPATELVKCQRYYSTSYPAGTNVGDHPVTHAHRQQGTQTSSGGGAITINVDFPVTMRTTDTTVAVYSPQFGVAGRFYSPDTQVDKNASYGAKSDKGFDFSNASGQQINNIDYYTYHWTADAEF